MSHCFQIALAVDSKAAEEGAAAAFLLLSMWEGLHGALALCPDSLTAQLSAGAGQREAYQEKGWYKLHHID